MKKAEIHILELRNSLGLTQAELANLLGVTVTTVSRWENYKSNPSKLALNQLKLIMENHNNEI
ncbi:MAG: helix-turn-helix domain-containing protein [Candidatus Komeilibacteria bacterium]